MTDKKILSPAEALRALADGKKLTFRGYDTYFWLDRGYIGWNDGTIYKSEFNNDIIEYTEATPKVVWVEYLCADEHGAVLEWHKESPPTQDQWTYTPTGRKIEV